MNQKTKYLTLLILLSLSLFLTACRKKTINQHRILLDKNWQYSLNGEPYPFYDFDINDLTNISDLLNNKIGYVFLKTTFTIPNDFKHKEIGLSIGRIKIATKIYINNHSLGRTGTFPPHEFTEGNKTFSFKIPKEYLNIGGENSLMICLWCHGYGIIESTPFISDYNDTEYVYSFKNVFYSFYHTFNH